MPERLEKQIKFIMEIDKAKQVFRQNLLLDGTRHENDAEHSWHLALMALVLSEYADYKIDLPKVIKMVLIHDIVEIYAGDTYCYDEVGYLDKEEREMQAASAIYGLLPDDQALEFMELWQEFEGESTAEARFAAALDRLQPLILNTYTDGYTWKKHDIDSSKVRKRNEKIAHTSQTLWEYAKSLIDQAIHKGDLRE